MEVFANVDLFRLSTPSFELVAEHALPVPGTPVWEEQMGSIATHVNAVLSREQSPRAGLESLASELQRIEQNA